MICSLGKIVGILLIFFDANNNFLLDKKGKPTTDRKRDGPPKVATLGKGPNKQQKQLIVIKTPDKVRSTPPKDKQRTTDKEKRKEKTKKKKKKKR